MPKGKIFGIFFILILFVFYMSLTGVILAEDCCDEKGTPTFPGNAEYSWGCECADIKPTIYDNDADDLIPSAGSVNLWVDSGGLACPPYTWTVDGEGWSIIDDDGDNETNNDLETITLSLINTSGKTCGVDYDVYCTVTVTDDCGITDTIVMRYSGGTWVNDSQICVGLPGSTYIYSASINQYRYFVRVYPWREDQAQDCTEYCWPDLSTLSAYFDGSANTNPQYTYFLCTSNKVQMYIGENLYWINRTGWLTRQIWGCP